MIDVKSKKLDELLTFPCEFSVKAIGLNISNFSEQILNIFATLSIPIFNDKIHFSTSNGDKYLSMTIYFHVQNSQQIQQVYEQIAALEFIKMCL